MLEPYEGKLSSTVLRGLEIGNGLRLLGNPSVAAYDECPDGVLDVYHLRNISEGVNSYLKNNLGLETHINGKHMKNIDLHATECCIVLLAVALTRLQHGITENLSSVAYLT